MRPGTQVRVIARGLVASGWEGTVVRLDPQLVPVAVPAEAVWVAHAQRSGVSWYFPTDLQEISGIFG